MLQKLKEPIDLTVGNPIHKIVLFMIPMLFGNLAQQLYSTVDSIIVGKFSGDNALAAVGSSGAILNLFVVVLMGISVGASIMVSQYVGSKDKKNLGAAIECCIVLTALTCVIMMVTAPLAVKPLLSLLGTPESIIEQAYDYLLITFVGGWGLAYFYILMGVLRGLGDAISPLFYLCISTVINIILDIVFVAYFKWDTAGVALATVIAQSISALLCLRKLFKMQDLFTISFKKPKMQLSHMKTIFRLGLPSGLNQLILSSALIMVQSLTNSYGELFIAANVIVMRIDGFAMMPNFSFGTAMSTFAGQNIGARQYDRVEKGARDGTIFAVATATVITSILLLFGRNLMSIFTDTPELVDLSMQMLQILAVGYMAMAVTQCLFGVMRGSGDTLTPMWISIFISVVVRVPVAYTLAYLTRTPELPNGRCESVFISLLASWILGAVITTIFYKKGNWKTKALERLEENTETTNNDITNNDEATDIANNDITSTNEAAEKF
ncbi:MAG: MATE family efflux transporter [Epulopiscium sp. Nuni2H_MBin001]|nr:MAG: MATE family efflux transporter [Epulopiscium sp. Nuni2H_MBin001]